jgi:hypothetical protein
MRGKQLCWASTCGSGSAFFAHMYNRSFHFLDGCGNDGLHVERHVGFCGELCALVCAQSGVPERRS